MVKEILIRIFEKNNRPMNVKELCREMLKEKMVSPNTVMLNLQKYKEHFQRIEKGVYELVKGKATAAAKAKAKAKKK